MIREATLKDIPALTELALIEAENYDYITAERDKVKTRAREAVSSKSAFLYVSEIGGEITGALYVHTQAHPWARKQAAQIVVWAGTECLALMRAYLAWFKSRPAIRYTAYSPDFEGGDRPSRLLKHLGFEDRGRYLILQRSAIIGHFQIN